MNSDYIKMKKIFNYTFITYIQNNEIYYFIVRYSIVEFDKLNFQLMRMMISPLKRLDLCPAIHSKNQSIDKELFADGGCTK